MACSTDQTQAVLFQTWVEPKVVACIYLTIHLPPACIRPFPRELGHPGRPCATQTDSSRSGGRGGRDWASVNIAAYDDSRRDVNYTLLARDGAEMTPTATDRPSRRRPRRARPSREAGETEDRGLLHAGSHHDPSTHHLAIRGSATHPISSCPIPKKG